MILHDAKITNTYEIMCLRGEGLQLGFTTDPTFLIVLLYSTLLVCVEKEKSLVNQRLTRDLRYPDPGSNRDGLLHWCLRPARLPIPPSGLNIPIKVVQS